MIKIRPHHFLDIIRDYGNEVKREPHPWGASLTSVTDSIISDISQDIQLVMNVDSICETCSKLNGKICEAQINDDLLMRDYNDQLDSSIFSALSIKPNEVMSIVKFLNAINDNIGILNYFNSPSNNPNIRRQGTESALIKFGVKNAT